MLASQVVEKDRTQSTALAGGLVFRLVAAGQDHRALIDLVEAGHRENRFGCVPFSREKAGRQLDAALEVDARHLMAVAESRRGSCSVWPGEYHLGNWVGS